MKKVNFKFFFSTLFLFVILSSCGTSGKDPEALLRKTGLKIDDYEIISQVDNLERGSSAWDVFTYSLKVKDDSQELRKQLDELVAKNENWTFQDGKYIFHKEKEDSWYLSIDVRLQHSEIHIEYTKYNIFS